MGWIVYNTTDYRHPLISTPYSIKSPITCPGQQPGSEHSEAGSCGSVEDRPLVIIHRSILEIIWHLHKLCLCLKDPFQEAVYRSIFLVWWCYCDLLKTLLVVVYHWTLTWKLSHGPHGHDEMNSNLKPSSLYFMLQLTQINLWTPQSMIICSKRTWDRVWVYRQLPRRSRLRGGGG